MCASLLHSVGGAMSATVPVVLSTLDPVLTDTKERQLYCPDFLSAHGGRPLIGRQQPARLLIGGERASCRLQKVTSL